MQEAAGGANIHGEGIRVMEAQGRCTLEVGEVRQRRTHGGQEKTRFSEHHAGTTLEC
jgi:hypothetical protein